MSEDLPEEVTLYKEVLGRDQLEEKDPYPNFPPRIGWNLATISYSGRSLTGFLIYGSGNFGPCWLFKPPFCPEIECFEDEELNAKLIRYLSLDEILTQHGTPYKKEE